MDYKKMTNTELVNAYVKKLEVFPLPVGDDFFNILSEIRKRICDRKWAKWVVLEVVEILELLYRLYNSGIIGQPNTKTVEDLKKAIIVRLKDD
jgi:transcription initiation factor IIE alpha subunit